MLSRFRQFSSYFVLTLKLFIGHSLTIVANGENCKWWKREYYSNNTYQLEVEVKKMDVQGCARLDLRWSLNPLQHMVELKRYNLCCSPPKKKEKKKKEIQSEITSHLDGPQLLVIQHIWTTRILELDPFSSTHVYNTLTLWVGMCDRLPTTTNAAHL